MATVESRVQIPFVDLQAQMSSIRDELTAAIFEVVDRGDFILGKSVDLFEKEFAVYCEVEHGVGVDSGTSGLEMALRAYGIGPGDEVITVANTFIATALAISHTGATPVLVDIDEATYGMAVEQVEGAITASTRAIIPVHLYGHPVDMDPLLEVADHYQLKVIEDASQAHGARYKGRRVGSIGDTAVFSLYPAKNLGAFGDAGIVVTDDTEIAERLRQLRNYGSSSKYVHEIRGHNRRLDTIQAAILRTKLRHLDDWNEKRRERSDRYMELFSEVGAHVTLPYAASYAQPVYHLFVIRTRDRDGLQRYLAKEGVSTLVHYPMPIHLQSAYADLGLGRGFLPVSERVSDEILSLPMYPELELDLIDCVVSAVRSFITGAES